MNLFASLIAVVILALIPASSPCEQLNDTTSCFNAIVRLSLYDKALGNRSTDKKATASKASSPNEFKKKVEEVVANATEYKCGETMSWVTEVFEGLESQYKEYSNGKQGLKAGYKNYIGQDLQKFFAAQKSSENRVIYHCQHVGACDHVFTIEQIPASITGGQGTSYRVYQSYNGAYSLHAWLSTDQTSEIGLAESGDIIVPHLTRCVNEINDTSGECVQMRAVFQQFANLGANGGLFEDFANFVKNFNVTEAVKLFSESWKMYGQGRLLSECEFFNDYLLKTRAVTEYYNENARTSNPHCSVISNYWSQLYGSPDPMRYPGLPSNVTSVLFSNVDYPSGYGLEIKAVSLPASSALQYAQCAENANVMLKSLESVIHKNV